MAGVAGYPRGVDANTQQLITLGIAVLGAVLGLLNWWRSFSADRLRLRVSVSHAFGLSGEQGLMINVINLSTFPVTVTHIGFDLIGTDRHIQLANPMFTQGERLPVRLESRTAFAVVQPLVAFQQDQLVMLKRAYVLTACGRRAQSKRGVLRQVNDAAAAAIGPPPS